jgi:hypothetical protein
MSDISKNQLGDGIIIIASLIILAGVGSTIFGTPFPEDAGIPLSMSGVSLMLIAGALKRSGQQCSKETAEVDG